MIIGIDLGTTNSLVSVWTEERGITMIPTPFGETLTPSVVGVDADGSILVGRKAKERLLTHPDKTIALVKRSMGDDVELTLDGKKYKPEELSAYILKSLKHDAEQFLGEEVRQCMISVPAYFTNAQRQATKSAAKIAGLEVLRLINEPTAAALAYGIQQETNCQYLVLDLGGGTFDVTLLDYFENVLSVSSSSGDKKLGGEDFTREIETYIRQTLELDDEHLSTSDRIKIYNAAESLKTMLADNEEVETTIPLSGGEAKIAFSNFTFRRISETLLQRIKATIIRTIRDAEVELDEIDKVILVGGSSRMKIYQHYIRSLLKKPPELNINIDESICVGVTAAVELKRENPAFGQVILTDVAPHSLGVDVSKHTTHGWTSGFFSAIIDRNSFVPCSFEKSYSTVEPFQSSIQFTIYQGESFDVKNNLKIGSLSINLIPRAETQTVSCRFTYDIDGVLLVDIVSDNAEQNVQSVFIENEGQLNDRDLEWAIQRLGEVKKDNAFESTNEFLIAWADRLYMETLPQQAARIEQAVIEFKGMIDNGSIAIKKKAQRKLKDFLAEAEKLKIDVLT